MLLRILVVPRPQAERDRETRRDPASPAQSMDAMTTPSAGGHALLAHAHGMRRTATLADVFGQGFRCRLQRMQHAREIGVR
jgi:hypothetical protein